jgi:hypothetical protein
VKRTSCGVARAFLVALAVASLAIGGCSGAQEALSGLTGGSSSKNKGKGAQKQQIPSMVKSSAQAPASPPAPVTQAPPAPKIEAPAAATKGSVTPVAETVADAPPATHGEPKPLREEEQAYTAMRNRDPFRSLIASDQERAEVVDLSVVTLVGIVWAQTDPFCIVEDQEGINYILRKGDAVKNGRVVAIHRDKLVASQTILGYTTTVQLTLAKEKGKTHG